MGSAIHTTRFSQGSDNVRMFDGDPLAAMERAHCDQLALCDALEEIADSLPHDVNRQKCLHTARSLWPMVRGVHRFEETVFFPVLEQQLAEEDGIGDALARLRYEHTEDECYAEDLTDTLLRLGANDPGLNAETVGYQLRGFFEAMRRHIAYERDHLIKVARMRGLFAAR